MEAFAAQGYSPNKLGKLNQCRLRLKVTTLSDTCSGDGNSILPDILKGVNPNQTHEYNWPVQGDPGPSNWKEWSRAIWETFAVVRNNTLPDHL
eukprot:15324006-Ditylum_brightwellii.AAC.1